MPTLGTNQGIVSEHARKVARALVAEVGFTPETLKATLLRVLGPPKVQPPQPPKPINIGAIASAQKRRRLHKRRGVGRAHW